MEIAEPVMNRDEVDGNVQEGDEPVVVENEDNNIEAIVDGHREDNDIEEMHNLDRALEEMNKDERALLADGRKVLHTLPTMKAKGVKTRMTKT